ncbi:MAG: hypothetical protein A2X35_01515 [Elusimicrobia bacterium GWA2_61_42]|nr:MAG: hypothetical protein A2X35_01515 [Elusimicrobia bacterium GWA2_61_42]OGR76825.1 MAG: hypothetical protein A2X38_11690 [Elusimicrobia bacterium GWC2_61_25]
MKFKHWYLAGGVAVLLCGCGKKKFDSPGNLGRLSSVRSALQVYYGDKDGTFPERLEPLVENGKYLAELPKLKLPEHPETNEVLYLSGPAVNPAKLTDTGGYAYYNSKGHPVTYGTVLLNCTHKNEKGQFWYSY